MTLPSDFSSSNLNVGSSLPDRSGSGTLFEKLGSPAAAGFAPPAAAASAAAARKSLRGNPVIRQSPLGKRLVSVASALAFSDCRRRHSSRSGRFEEEPDSPFGLVDPVLDQAGRCGIIMIVAHRVRTA